VEKATAAAIEAQTCSERAAALAAGAKGMAQPTKPPKESENPEADAMRIWSDRTLQGG
jgi:hypothetical protein